MLTRIAIVGSGPSGLYTAKYLLDGHPSLRIDFFEKLCTPFGLVRYGIAPDHQDAKNVATTLTPVLASERVRFFGNVEFGTSVHLEFLQKRYSAIVFASGNPTRYIRFKSLYVR
jgi:ferredoxin--NADP+ reductase